MDMGFNRYLLKQQSPRTWQARQIHLPVCVEGRRDYIAGITIGNQTFQTTFTAQ
jgi:putative secreted protein